MHNIWLKIIASNILHTTVSDVGNAFFKTFFKNFPFTLALFGCNASTNDGIPIVTVFISENCIGLKGYGMLINTNRIAKIHALPAITLLIEAYIVAGTTYVPYCLR